MTPDERVLLERRGPLRVVTLQRPEKLNAADLPLQRRLVERFDELANDADTRTVVLTGAGRAFCSGGDRTLIGTPDRAVRGELSRIHDRLMRGMLGLAAPIVAAVHGPAVGFGAELAALCDLVVMDRDAFLSDPHVRHGLPPSPGCQLVWPHLTSRSVAIDLLLSGRHVGADEALRLGLANRVTAPGDALRVALELAGEIAMLPEAGVAALKRAFGRSLLDEMVQQEQPTTW